MLQQVISKENRNTWLILHGERGNPFSTSKLENLKDKAEPYFICQNRDKTLKIYKLDDNAKIM